MAQGQIDPTEVERKKEEIKELVRQMKELADGNVPPNVFFQEYLDRLVRALAAVGGAIWVRTQAGGIQLAAQVSFLEHADWTSRDGANDHGPFLSYMFQDGKACLCPPGSGPDSALVQFPRANPSDYYLIAAPVIVEGNRVGVIELLLQKERRAQALQNAVEFTSRVSEICGQYIRRLELRQLSTQQQLWRQLDDFVRHIHSTLDLREVCYHVANEAKRVLGCDRVSVALMRGRKAVVYAVSGQDMIERKSNLIQQMSRLARAVIRSNRNIAFAGLPDETWPPAIHDAVDDFVAESGAKAFAVVLLRRLPKGDEEDERRRIDEPGEPMGAIIVEQLQDSRGVERLLQQAEVLAEHASRAVHNALEYQQIFLLPVWRTLGRAREWVRGKKLVKLAIVLTLVIGIASALAFVPKELRIEGRGEILPERRQIVFAPEDGIVVEIYIDDSQLVDEGDPLLRLENPELVKQRQDLQRQLLDAQTRLRQVIAAQSIERGREHGPGLRTQIEAEIASLEQQIRLYDRRIESLTVRAPIAGMIASWDVRRNLFQRPVKRGDVLLTVADVDEETWELDVRMPEDQMGHVLEALERHEREGLGPLRARFMLASHPEQVFFGHVKRIAPQAEYDKERGEHVHRVTIALDDVEQVQVEKVREGDIEKVREVILTFSDGRTLRLTPGSEVRAKIDCGQTSLGYALFHEVIELIHTVLF